MDIRELEQHRVTNDVRQSKWTHRRTYVVNGHKVRVTVSHDPYEFQCDYYAELFNPSELKWNRVHTEDTTWGRGFDALKSTRLTPDQWETIDTLCDHMVAVCADLLEGVNA